jgi:hypothetical protein
MTGGADGEWLQREKTHPYALWFRWRDLGQRSSNSANIKVCEEKNSKDVKEGGRDKKKQKSVESVKKRGREGVREGQQSRNVIGDYCPVTTLFVFLAVPVPCLTGGPEPVVEDRKERKKNIKKLIGSPMGTFDAQPT